jgi:hypothetical protein
MTQQYIVYGSELSYFTRKLEAALIFYGANFERRAKDPAIAADIEARAGTHQVPVLHTPENWMIADAAALLDASFAATPVSPACCGVMSSKSTDEWIARTMVHYRRTARQRRSHRRMAATPKAQTAQLGTARMPCNGYRFTAPAARRGSRVRPDTRCDRRTALAHALSARRSSDRGGLYRARRTARPYVHGSGAKTRDIRLSASRCVDRDRRKPLGRRRRIV